MRELRKKTGVCFINCPRSVSVLVYTCVYVCTCVRVLVHMSTCMCRWAGTCVLMSFVGQCPLSQFLTKEGAFYRQGHRQMEPEISPAPAGTEAMPEGCQALEPGCFYGVTLRPVAYPLKTQMVAQCLSTLCPKVLLRFVRRLLWSSRSSSSQWMQLEEFYKQDFPEVLVFER